jgi:hypothetical protein
LPTLASAERYDPMRGNWERTAPMHYRRYGATALLLPDGRAIIAGGKTFGEAGEPADRYEATRRTAEIYDPVTRDWVLTDRAPRGDIEWAGVLPDGDVLSFADFRLTQAQVYEPATRRWSVVDMTANINNKAALTLLPTGYVLAAGRRCGARALATTRVLDPTTGVWAARGDMSTPRYGQVLVDLADGQVLAASGYQWRQARLNPGTCLC